jgi:hypothetical protein
VLEISADEFLIDTNGRQERDTSEIRIEIGRKSLRLLAFEQGFGHVMLSSRQLQISQESILVVDSLAPVKRQAVIKNMGFEGIVNRR